MYFLSLHFFSLVLYSYCVNLLLITLFSLQLVHYSRLACFLMRSARSTVKSVACCRLTQGCQSSHTSHLLWDLAVQEIEAWGISNLSSFPPPLPSLF